jgi:hypothetical protein
MKKHTWKIDLAGLLLIVSVACAHEAETPRVYEKPVPKGKTAAPDSGCVDKVRTMLDNMIDYPT